jgi:hypothetical protein
MSNRRDLKAYVRYDGSGRVIPGSNILQRKKPKVGNWKEIDANLCCNPTPPSNLPLRLTFDSIENANLLVGDSSSVNDWNTFFDLPNLGTSFTSVVIVGNEVQLFGGANIKVKPALMYDYNYNTFLISIIDNANCITSVGGDAFSYCYGLTTVNLPACTIIYGLEDSPYEQYGGFGNCENLTNVLLPNLIIAGSFSFSECFELSNINFPLLNNIDEACFDQCTSITIINIPSCTNLGGTVENNLVFNFTGNTITATFNSVLATNNSGNPDGDIQYLQSNNTVTITYV